MEIQASYTRGIYCIIPLLVRRTGGCVKRAVLAEGTDRVSAKDVGTGG